MRKFLRFSLMMLFAVFGMSNAMAGKIVFAEITPALANGVQYTDPFDGGDFTVTFAGGGNDGKYYTTGSGIRVYGNGTMTITATSGTLTKILITYDGDYKPDNADVVSVGTYDPAKGLWTGDAAEVVFTRPTGSGHWRIKAIATNDDVEDSGDDPVVPEFQTVANIAAFKALNSGDEAKLTLSNAKVLFAKGNDIFVKDNTGAIDFYKTGLSSLTTGSTVSGTVIGKYSPYNNLPEFVKNDYTNSNDLTITAGTVEATAVTVASVSDTYICDLIKLTNVKVVQKTEDEKTNNYATDGTNEVLFYNKFSVSNALNAIDPEKPDNTYDIEGILVYSGENLAIGVTKAVVVNQETGESYTFVGDGTETNPYTVEDVRHIDSEAYPADKVWVKGIIIGSAKSALALHAGTEEDADVASNIALADEASSTKFIPVELPNNTEFRTKLNVLDNPSNKGQEVLLYGNVTSYFSTTGVKNLEKAVIGNETLPSEKEEPGFAWSETSATVTIGADDNIFPTLTNPNSLAVTYESSKPEVATINSDGEITLVAAGTTKISAKFAGNDTYKASTVSYTLTVQDAETVDIGNTEETAYTVAKAIELIDAGEGLSAEVFVKGIICQIDKFNDDKTITYWISDDGTTANKFECYHGKNLEGADFAAATDLKVGATVIVKGKMTKYYTTYEFGAGNVLVSYDESTAGGDPEEIDATIAGLYNYTTATPNIKLTINNGKVVYVDGKSVYVRDGEKAILFYDCGLTLPVNATVSGTVSVDLDIYKGLHEVKANSKTNADNLTITESSDEAAPVEATFDKLASKDYTNDLIIIKNQSVIEDDGKWYIQNGDAKIQLFKKNADYSSYVSDTKKYDIIAIATVYNSNAQLTPISFSETTGIQNLTIDADANAPMYNLKGERVDANYRGVVIKAGKKTIQK